MTTQPETEEEAVAHFVAVARLHTAYWRTPAASTEARTMARLMRSVDIALTDSGISESKRKEITEKTFRRERVLATKRHWWLVNRGKDRTTTKEEE